MAGSSPAEPRRLLKRRRNIQGHTIVADQELLAKLHRLSSVTLNNLFRQAHEQGMAPFRIDDEPYLLTRLPDHTFTVVPQDQRNHPVL